MLRSGGVGRRERKASRAVSSPGIQIAVAALAARSTGTDEGPDVVEPKLSREPTRSRHSCTAIEECCWVDCSRLFETVSS